MHMQSRKQKPQPMISIYCLNLILINTVQNEHLTLLHQLINHPLHRYKKLKSVNKAMTGLALG
jgi:hypothetical protein